uniref:Potassium channel domain-containing protein n=1 Tax=Schizophyllum commune (strain H4-8 / FGSC 9210) TaxID=578458 RepID=D8PYP2_SCHCM
MDDYGLGEPMQDAATHVNDAVRNRSSSRKDGFSNGDATRNTSGDSKQDEAAGFSDPTSSAYSRAKRWWMMSTGFPLIAGTFGPLANLFSVCALVQTWRVQISPDGNERDGERVPDPHWVLAPNIVSLVFAVGANMFLLMNFGHRMRYTIAQPLTVAFWYLSFILLLVPLALSKHMLLYPRDTHAFSQSYYYAIISASVYCIISTLLLANLLGALVFKAYPPSFGSLTVPQRTLMLQTTAYVFYLALGALVFSYIEGWSFVDGLYWADYTLLTCGLGTDFPLYRTLSRALLIPYAVIGITMIGLVIGSVRALVLERGATAMVRRRLEKERKKWVEGLDGSADVRAWEKREFEEMRRIQQRADWMKRYMALATSTFAFAVLWLIGALIFWYSERPQNWTYFNALYFAYTTLITVGYGDFYPQSNSGKPFFVFWTLLAVPTMTVLISNMGDTILVTWVKEGVLWLAEKTLMPGNGNGNWNGKTSDDNPRRREEDGLVRPIEKLGEAVEREEEGELTGRARLIRRLAHEVRVVADDVGQEKAYEWDAWSRWMRLLGEADEWLAERDEGFRHKRESSHRENESSHREEEQLSWLAYDGPMFSEEDEAQWLLTRFCEKLEQIMVHT